MPTAEQEATMSTDRLPTDLVYVKEAAQRTGANIFTLRSWLRAGKIAEYKRGGYRVLVSLADVERMQRIERVEGRGE